MSRGDMEGTARTWPAHTTGWRACGAGAGGVTPAMCGRGGTATPRCGLLGVLSAALMVLQERARVGRAAPINRGKETEQQLKVHRRRLTSASGPRCAERWRGTNTAASPPAYASPTTSWSSGAVASLLVQCGNAFCCGMNVHRQPMSRWPLSDVAQAGTEARGLLCGGMGSG